MLPFGFPLDFPFAVDGLGLFRPVLLGKVLDLPNKGIVELAIVDIDLVYLTRSQRLAEDGGVGGRPVEGV